MSEGLQGLKVISDKNRWGEPMAWAAPQIEWRKGYKGLRWSPTGINEVNQRLELLPEVNDEGAVKAW